MDFDRHCLPLCAAALALAVLLRLGAAGALKPEGEWLQEPQTASFLLYLQTGRVVRTDAGAPVLPVLPTEPPATVTEPAPTTLPPVLPVFAPQETEQISMYYLCDYRPDLDELLTRPLTWDLTGAGPKVLLIHTHTSESYTPGSPGEYEPSGDYRTLDPDYNVLHIGALVCDRLNAAGIETIQDRQVHDYPSYNNSYPNARAAAQALLEQYPTIELILDLHRDAAETPAGQLVTECSIGGQTGAQLMAVVGTDAHGLEHPHWQDNLALALKLQTLLERENPGICRRLTLSDQRYNQDLGRRALLIEVGTAGNTLPQAELAAEELARAVIALSRGSE